MFTRNEGIVIRVDTNKINIVASELTEEIFAEKNYLSNRYEKEYVVSVPDNYIINTSGIFIEDQDYYQGAESPLFVQYLHHDDVTTEYDFKFSEDVYSIKAYGYWSTNTKFVKSYGVTNKNGIEVDYYGNTLREFIKRYGFNPIPNKDNLNLISNFHIKERKRW